MKSLRKYLQLREELSFNIVATTGVIAWALAIGSWLLLTWGNIIAPIFLPTPGQVLDAFDRLMRDGTLPVHIIASCEVVLAGFAISSVVAIPIGLLMGSLRIVQAFLEPLVNFIRYLPVTSFVPLFILWIGIGIEERITVIIFGVFFQQIIMIADVVKGIPKDLLNASYTLGCRRRDVLLHVITPASLPGIIDTLRITIGWAWTYLVVAEMVAASSGLGYLSLKASRGFNVEITFLAIIIIGLLGMITDRVFHLIRVKFTGWAK